MHHGYNLNCYKLVVAWLLSRHMEIWTQLPQEALGPTALGLPVSISHICTALRVSCVNCVHISHMALEAMLQLLHSGKL